MKKNIVFIITIIICSFFITGCGNSKLKNGEEVAFKVNGKNITADDLYKELKEKSGISITVDMIDKKIFDVVYKDDEEIEAQSNNQLEALKTQYADSWNETLENAGYKSESELKNYFILNYQRTKAIKEYVKESIKDDEIKIYYEKDTAGDISAKHILIKVDTESENGLTDDEAKAKAKKLIKKLDEGASFDELAKENSDDTGSKESGGDLGYFNKGDMVEEFENAAYSLKVNKYTKEPVKSSFGYHIILKTGEKDKPELKDIKENIIENLMEERLEEDATLQITALDEIRKSYNLKFTDSKIKKQYNNYIKQSIEQVKNNSLS